MPADRCRGRDGGGQGCPRTDAGGETEAGRDARGPVARLPPTGARLRVCHDVCAASVKHGTT
jgi:hypothetical protein